MKIPKCLGIAFAFILLLLCENAFSQQVQEVPLMPLEQLQLMRGLSQLPPQQPVQTQRTAPVQPPQTQVVPVPPPEAAVSDSERFVSGVPVELSDFQFEIVKNFKEITFQFSRNGIPPGNIAAPVKVLKTKPDASAPELVNAGYLVGKPEALGSVFTLLGVKGAFPLATDLRQFGYDLFGRVPASFASVESVPVGPDYVIGPGDEIRISVWGKIEGQWNAVVDRDGSISLPKIGSLGVTGLTFKELKETLHTALSKYYTGFEMNVSLGALRTVRIYLVGNARNPGAYTISSLSTLVSALFEAGGPSKVGTMRDLQLRRNGKTLVRFDLYDLLIRGDKTKDVRLMPEDVLFIPPIGPVAAVAGSVNSPAIYEIKEEKTIYQLVGMAGGVNAFAFQGRVQVERIMNNNRQVVFESDMEQIKDKELPLQSGDIVRIFAVVEDKRLVKLAGAVQREGDYGFRPGMTVKDLIEMSGGLKYYSFTKEAELTRVHVTSEGPRTEKILVRLGKAIAGEDESNIVLQENDYLFVRPVPEWKLYQTVSLSGEVMFPGTYTIKKGERLSSLLERGGGSTDRAYLKGTVFLRPSVGKAQQKHLDDAIDRLEKQVLSLSVIEAQTALTPQDAASQKSVQMQQQALLAKLRSAKALGRLTIKIESLEGLKDSFYDVELEDGDLIHLPGKPASVNVIGSVYNPSAFVQRPDAALSDYIAMAGGMTEEAESSDIFVLKVDGSAVSRQQSSFLGMRWNPETKRIESGTFMSLPLDPGDTIVVPPKLERISWLKEIKDITQIIYQIAVTAGVLIVAF